MGIRLLVVLAVLLPAPACVTTTTAPGSLPPPDLEIVVRHRTGSTFRSRGAAKTIPTPDDFNSLVVTFHAVENLSDTLLESVTAHSELYLQSGHRGLFMPAPKYVAATRIGFGPDAARAVDVSARDGVFGRTVEIGRASGIVAPGTTAVITLQETEPVSLSHLRQPVHESIFLDLTQAADGQSYTMSIGIRMLSEPGPGLSTAGMSAEDAAAEREQPSFADLEGILVEAFVVNLDVSKIPHAVLAVVPAPFLGDGLEGIIVSALISSPPAAFTADEARHKETVRSFDLTKEQQEAQAERASLETPLGREVWSGLEGAIGGLDDPDRSRSALAWLARETGARLAEDLALASSDRVVATVVTRIHAATKELPKPCPADKVGLVLERCAYGVLLEYLEARDPSPAAVGLIARHTGEVGRHPTVLEEVVSNAASLADLRELLLLENRTFLEDSSPVSRVRAYDWLVLHGRAPTGYDPLASREERREVMNRYYEGLETKGGEE